jgi:uncharacterized repeat protein (TIGR04076 family)
MGIKNCKLDLTSIEFEVTKASKKCVYRIGEKVKLSSIIPKNECFFALHETFPYHLTLKNKGYFKWQANANTVISQCPNPEVAVAIGVIRESGGKADKIRAKVLASRSDRCPVGYRKGDEILKKVLNNPKICLACLEVLFPYCLFLEAAKKKKEEVKPIVVQCGACDPPAVFKLSIRKRQS